MTPWPPCQPIKTKILFLLKSHFYINAIEGLETPNFSVDTSYQTAAELG